MQMAHPHHLYEPVKFSKIPKTTKQRAIKPAKLSLSLKKNIKNLITQF
jgi:RAB protein geranylgeranyltransferase component A